MAIKLVLTSEEILNKVFPKRNQGYDSFQVDSFLDRVLSDYRTIEKNVLLSIDEYKTMTDQVNSLRKRVKELEVENGKYKARLGNITDNPNVSLENIRLLNRISNLETALYKAGINPNTIK